MQNITPEQALNLVDQVASQFVGTRADHVALERAVATLRDFVAAHNVKTTTEAEESKKE